MKTKKMEFDFFDLSVELENDIFYFLNKIFYSFKQKIDIKKLSYWISSTEKNCLGYLIGSVVKNEDTVCCLNTLIPFTKQKEHPAYQIWNVIENLLSQTEKPLKKYKENISLVLNERIANIPKKLTKTLYSILLSDINDIKEEYPELKTKYIIFLSSCYKNVKTKEFSYYKEEEEELEKKCLFKKEIPITLEKKILLNGEKVIDKLFLFILKRKDFKHFIKNNK